MSFKKQHPERTKKYRYENYKKSIQEKYGVDNYFQTQQFKDNIKQSNIEKYGCESHTQVESVKEKRRITFIERYGCEYPLQSKEIREKFEKTSLEKYGVKQPILNKKVSKRNKQIIYNKYGVYCVLQSDKIKNKIKEDMIKSGKYHLINGMLIRDYYNSLNLNIKYNTFRQYYYETGNLDFLKDIENSKFLIKRKSAAANKWLNSIEEKLGYKLLREYKIVKYYVDGFDPNTNTIYEFYGDYWHGNPDVFNLNALNKNKKVKFKELYIKTLLREIELMKKYPNIITIWENDYNKLLNK